MEIQESLKRFRQNFKLKQKDVAEVLGVTPQAYQVYESKVTPSAKVIKKIAEHYKVSADYLLGLSDNPAPPVKPAENEMTIEERLARIEAKLNIE